MEPYPADLTPAARRHLHAADICFSGGRQDVAGYLYGLAAEIALKALMNEVGLRLNDAFYAHFPEIKALLLDQIRGRRQSKLQRFLGSSFINNWHVKMRYSHQDCIAPHHIQRWREEAHQIVNTIGTL